MAKTTFTVAIELDNAAFAQGAEGSETARILHTLAYLCEARDCAASGEILHDINGNKVGATQTRKV